MASVRIKGVNAQNGMDVQLDFWTASEGKIASNFWCFYWQAKASALPFHPFQVLRHLVAFVQPYLIGFSYYIIISLPRHRRFPQFALYTHMHQFPSSVKLGRLPPCITTALLQIIAYIMTFGNPLFPLFGFPRKYFSP